MKLAGVIVFGRPTPPDRRRAMVSSHTPRRRSAARAMQARHTAQRPVRFHRDLSDAQFGSRIDEIGHHQSAMSL
jgi:hypothetical protein